jgi:hypothetical protein
VKCIFPLTAIAINNKPQTQTYKYINAKLTNHPLPSWHLDVTGDYNERTGT